EVVQLYIHAEKSKVERALRELKGFQKVFLKPGETKEVSLTLRPIDFAFYDVNKKAWHVEEGKYDIQIGSSCADIKLSQPVKMNEKIIKD
ncbi:MAG: fibronectin type III-like domain-contianing protein, partial [Bacteroidia bacterium]